MEPFPVEIGEDGPADADQAGGAGHGVQGQHEVDHLMAVVEVAGEAAAFPIDVLEQFAAHLQIGWRPRPGGPV